MSCSTCLSNNEIIVSCLKLIGDTFLEKCELCATKFRFAPKYAEGAPDTLPLYEVCLGLSRRTFARWVPLTLRYFVAISLWLVVAPLATSYSYYGWMNRPSSVPTRWKRELILGDAISGAVVAGVVIISFLSLMSFADFLRFHWQQHGPGGPPPRERLDEDGRVEAVAAPPPDDEVDDVILDLRRQRNRIHQVGVMDQRQPLFASNQRRPHPIRRVRWMDLDAVDGLGKDIHQALGVIPDDPVEQRHELQRRIQAAAALRQHVESINDQLTKINNTQNVTGDVSEELERINIEDNGVGDHLRAVPERYRDDEHLAGFLRTQGDSGDDGEHRKDQTENNLLVDFGELYDEEPVNNFNEAQMALFLRAQERGGDNNDDHREEGGDEPDRHDEPMFPENDRFEPQFEPLDPVMNQEEPVDMEMNVALDELLGLRGPLRALLRNLIWFLAFNVTYLGLFAFLPRCFGSLVYILFLKTTTVHRFMNHIPYYNLTNTTVEGDFGLVQLVLSLEGESKRLSALLQLSDFAIIGLGYASTAITVASMQYSVVLYRKLWPTPKDDNVNTPHVGGHVALEGIPRMQDGDLDDPFNDPLNPQVDRFPGDLQGTIGEMLTMALDSTAAVVKVGVLLFLKMLLLPLVLGIWLDVATLTLFSSSVTERMLHAGGDLFASALLHWVVGITFMLLVTVSVLQLREVMHPSLLAKIIRPQEPQPDLLGNLLNENGFVHAKRMALSFGIYVILLAVLIWIPVKVIATSGLSSYLPFSKPKLFYIFPTQLQIPLELLLFHLSMLSLLEKYKNNIGETQHRWLAFICDKLDLSDYLLPRNVDKFVLTGYRPIFINMDDSSDEFDLIPEDDIVTATTGSSTECDSRTSGILNVVSTSPLRQIKDILHVDPFWYKLAKKPHDAVHLIESKINSTATLEEPMFQLARTRRDGQRILVGSKAFIRLPLPSGEQDFVDRRRRREGADATPPTVDCKNVFSSKQGPYRLQRSTRGNGTMVIEFWKEVPGHLIPRPPEGWDDLGAGGAEVQGRWYWGKETPSTVEHGVAYRKPIFDHGSHILSTLPILSKLSFMLIISWIAISLLIFCGISAPLFAGRTIMYLLRLPEEYHHDPFAVAIGLAVVCPLLVALTRFMKHGSGAWTALGRWVSLFRLPPKRKAVTIIATVGIWVILAPLLIGFLYDLFFFRASTWFIDEDLFRLLDESFVTSLVSGTLLLNIWAAMCYSNALTQHFWFNVANAAFVEENGQNGRQGQHLPALDRVAKGARDGDGEYLGNWQGKDGRIGRFVGVIKAVLLNWEWEQVDPDILVYHFLVPIVSTLGFSFVAPVTFYISWRAISITGGTESAGIIAPIFGQINNGLYRLIVFRAFMALIFMTQFMISFQSQLKDWFKVAHKAARDDRYLVGEVLLNYSQVPQQPIETR